MAPQQSAEDSATDSDTDNDNLLTIFAAQQEISQIEERLRELSDEGTMLLMAEINHLLSNIVQISCVLDSIQPAAQYCRDQRRRELLRCDLAEGALLGLAERYERGDEAVREDERRGQREAR